MENVVPGVLQRLRAADIIRMAGLTAASLGQEYCRAGAVHSTQRQGSCLKGIIDISHTVSNLPSSAEDGDRSSLAEKSARHYAVSVDLSNASAWVSTCPCSSAGPSPCAHSAALLYQWLTHASSFETITTSTVATGPTQQPAQSASPLEKKDVALPTKPTRTTRPIVQHNYALSSNLTDILTRMGLSELRNIAREYEIVVNGLSKQQLVEAIRKTLDQPELVRRVAATLEKPQRQLLAALTLAGGFMTDDDLRGLFERFALGQPAQLQSTLITLQGKALLFRTSLNSSFQQRLSPTGSLLDLGWYVPNEIRAALRVTVPVTSFDIKQLEGESDELPLVHWATPYALLDDLLLVTRALDGYRLSHDDKWAEGSSARASDTSAFARFSASQSSDGSIPVPPPRDTPSTSLLNTLQYVLDRPPAFLRFAVRLLRLADILYRDDSGTPYLRALPNAAQLLIGTGREETIRDLFALWLTRASYEELFSLQEEGLRLCCRSASLTVPLVRPGELDVENAEARQFIIALLALAPINQWIGFTAFARFVYRLNPAFLQKRQRLFSSPHWWLEREDGRVLSPLQINDWLRAEIYYLARLIYGPLHWWGVCDIALSQDGRLLAFRLTAMASWLLNGLLLKEEAREQNDRILSQSLEIVNAEELLVTCSAHAWPIIEVLEMFTEAAGVRNGRLCYRLTPRALAAAFSRGHSPARLLEVLRSLRSQSAQEHESSVQILSQLEGWIAGYGTVRIYTGVTLLEAVDAVVMRELSATTSIDEQIVHAIQPNLLILKKSGAERVSDELKRRGQSPLLHEEEL